MRRPSSMNSSPDSRQRTRGPPLKAHGLVESPVIVRHGEVPPKLSAPALLPPEGGAGQEPCDQRRRTVALKFPTARELRGGGVELGARSAHAQESVCEVADLLQSQLAGRPSRQPSVGEHTRPPPFARQRRASPEHQRLEQ